MREVYYYRVVKRPALALAEGNKGPPLAAADLEARIARLAARARVHAPLFTAADRDGAAERGERVRE